MLSQIVTALVIFVCGFIVGAFVYRNNKDKADKIADQVEETVDNATSKAKEALDKLKEKGKKD